METNHDNNKTIQDSDINEIENTFTNVKKLKL